MKVSRTYALLVLLFVIAVAGGWGSLYHFAQASLSGVLIGAVASLGSMVRQLPWGLAVDFSVRRRRRQLSQRTR
jgi:hypothetical protein